MNWKPLSCCLGILKSGQRLAFGLKPLAFSGLSSEDGCQSKYSLDAFVFQETRLMCLCFKRLMRQNIQPFHFQSCLQPPPSSFVHKRQTLCHHTILFIIPTILFIIATILFIIATILFIIHTIIHTIVVIIALILNTKVKDF